MSKDSKRIRKEELNEYNELRRDIQEVARTVGMYELQKQQFVSRLDMLNTKYSKFIDKMEKKYGKNITISTETGEISREAGE